MVMLQEEVASKEDERAKAMRDRAQKRTVRFMNAKNRTIGVDKAYLDLQLSEKEHARIAQEKADSREALYQAQLIRHLEETELMAREVKAKDYHDLKETLLEQMQLPKNNALGMDGPLDMEACGPSSLQRFSGEDTRYGSRRKHQQEQTKQWCAQQISAKKKAQKEEEEENLRYAHYVLEEDRHREEVALDEAKNTAEINKSVQLDNMCQAKEARMKTRNEQEVEKRKSEAEVSYLQSCALLSEETDTAKNVLAEHRYRPDHFKGFHKEKVQHIYNENDNVIKEKYERCVQEKEHEMEWAAHQEGVIRQMEEAEIERRRHMEKENQTQTAAWEIQRLEVQQRKKHMEKDRFGAIDEGFFQGFGQSCR